MDENKINEMMEIGKVSADAISRAAEMVKPGVKFIDVAEAAEKHMREKGYGLAFPINISVNHVAAHYAPTLGDAGTFSQNDVVKIDFGAEKNGMLGDGALTVDLSGRHSKLVETAHKALEDAIATVKAGVEVREIGKVISDVVEKGGFKVIQNLGGHAIEENSLHSGGFIPNYDNGDTETLEEGSIIAIEPFITTQQGKGFVKEEGLCEIYGFVRSMPVRSDGARAILAEIESRYPKNPFAVRWLADVNPSKFGLYAGIAELYRAGCLDSNPVLSEAGNGIVAQAEAELIVEKGGCKIVTLAKKQI